MKLTNQVNKEIIRKLLHSENYRDEIVALIDAEFMTYAVEFLKQVVKSKGSNSSDTWYIDDFLNSNLKKEDLAINAGLNMKTISNYYNSATKEIVIAESLNHFNKIDSLIENFLSTLNDLEISLKISDDQNQIDLSFKEFLIVLNSIAVKRAALRGGAWSTAGKRVEKPLMLTMCKIFGVNEKNYAVKVKGKELAIDEFEREIDFFLIGTGKFEKELKCEVKLMGVGNPESADAVIARDSDVFIADKLSDTNKKQLNSRSVQWVELRSELGFRKFTEILDAFGIPHVNLPSKWEDIVDSYLNEILI